MKEGEEIKKRKQEKNKKQVGKNEKEAWLRIRVWYQYSVSL